MALGASSGERDREGDVVPVLVPSLDDPARWELRRSSTREVRRARLFVVLGCGEW